MTSTTDIQLNTFQEVSKQEINPTVPIHAVFIANQLRKFHGKLKSYLCYYLNPKSVELCTKLVYALPASLAIKALSTTQVATIGVLAGTYLWSCKEELIKNESKINLLHSVAMGFFVNMLNLSNEFSQSSLLRLPFDLTFLTTSILIANQIEKTSTDKSFTLCADNSPTANSIVKDG